MRLAENVGVEWTPVSPALAKARLLVWGALAFLLCALGAGLVLLGHPWGWALACSAVAVLGWALFLVPRQVRNLGYALRESDLLVRRGALWHSVATIPYGRIQYVDVSSGPVARRYGIAAVTLKTASLATDAALPGLPVEEAERVRRELAARGSRDMMPL